MRGAGLQKTRREANRSQRHGAAGAGAGGRGPGAGGRAEHGALALRAPHGPSSLMPPPPVPGRRAISEMRSSRGEDPRGPGDSGDKGRVAASAAGAARVPIPVLRARQRAPRALVAKTCAVEPSRGVGSKPVSPPLSSLRAGTRSPRQRERGRCFSEEAHGTTVPVLRCPENTLAGDDFSLG